MHKHANTNNALPHSLSSSSVAIVGARGYAGAELTRILLGHPGVNEVLCLTHESAFEISEYLPGLSPEKAAKAQVLPLSELSRVLNQVQTVFLATPAETSYKLAPEILNAGVSVIDLSGAFRLNEDQALKHYSLPAPAAALLGRAHYGLVPFSGPCSNQAPQLIANPGCYATASLMGLLPLLREKLIRPDAIVIDAKSGTTGAGRKASENLLFSEVQEECRPYRVGKHQHLPEIMQYAAFYAGYAEACIKPHFVTHLLPVRRGILAGIYCQTLSGIGLNDIENAFQKAYADYTFVSSGWLDPEKRSQLSFKAVVGTPRTEIRFELNGNQLYVFSMIDNLLKGAASQAVENFNRLRDFPLNTALNSLEGIL